MYSAEHKTSSHIIIIINIPLIDNLTVLDVPTYCACNVYGLVQMFLSSFPRH